MCHLVGDTSGTYGALEFLQAETQGTETQGTEVKEFSPGKKMSLKELDKQRVAKQKQKGEHSLLLAQLSQRTLSRLILIQ